MKVLIIGATGGSGRVTCEALLDRGHHVTAVSRHATSQLSDIGVHAIDLDVTTPAGLDGVLSGHDAVVVTLGISEPTLRVRLLGARRTPQDVRSRGTKQIVAAASRAGVKRLVVQSSYGVGDSRRLLGTVDRMILDLFIKPQLQDSAVQEDIVRASGLDWTIVQPIYLSDSDSTERHVTADGTVRGKKVSRRAVGQLHADLVEQGTFVHATLAVSG